MHDDHELGRREPPVPVELKDSARPAQEHQAEQDARREIPAGGWSTMEIEPRFVCNWHLPPDHPHAVICEASTIDAAETIAQALNGRAERDALKAEVERLQDAIRQKGGTEHYPTEDAYLSACRSIKSKDAEIARLRSDLGILLSQIDWLEECTGEGLETEDAALVAKIRASMRAHEQGEG